ncbi:MAG: ADP-ribosylglycohydrolase family protein [Spirochaetia bacterium]|nr:ADP-ribosylglycohydrolase family protein [Spirochaetia bacterium]
MKFKSLLGIFIGDCMGSLYEAAGYVSGDEIGPYTDDTEQAYGIALWLNSQNLSLENLESKLKEVYSGSKRGYGRNQASFLENKPYRKDSYGNGASMRIAPAAEFASTPEEAVEIAKKQCMLTHNNSEAIDGAVTIALLAYLIKEKINPMKITDYYADALLPEAGRDYKKNLRASESVPLAVEAFLRGNSFEDTGQKALSYGGDTDTIAAMACGLASLKYEIPDALIEKVINAHSDNLKLYNKIAAFI